MISRLCFFFFARDARRSEELRETCAISDTSNYCVQHLSTVRATSLGAVAIAGVGWALVSARSCVGQRTVRVVVAVVVVKYAKKRFIQLRRPGLEVDHACDTVWRSMRFRRNSYNEADLPCVAELIAGGAFGRYNDVSLFCVFFCPVAVSGLSKLFFLTQQFCAFWGFNSVGKCVAVPGSPAASEKIPT